MPIVVVLALLAGCLPIPHTTPRSGEVHGRVLDAITKAPIKDAKIFFISSPQHPVYTDAAGYFHRKAISNFHWFYLAPEGNWPDAKNSDSEVTHLHYLPVSGDWRGDVGDILMKPEPEQASTR